MHKKALDQMKSSHCLGIYRLLTRFPLENVLLHKSYMIRERSVVCVQNWWKWHSADLTHTNPNTTKVQRSIIRGMGHCEKCFAYIVYNTWLGVNCIWNDTDMMEWLFQPRILIRQFCLTKLETAKKGTESNFVDHIHLALSPVQLCSWVETSRLQN